ncbi:MAG: thiolase family protein [Chloroflexi bacterium]|nr:thiolase family protein [Chloroflexota bacterium]MBU1748604.1 thiolase family protein [Chloroflexota bacterium]
MKEVVIVSGVRTPIGSHGGALRDIKAQDLAALVFRTAVDRAGIDPKIINDVILGCIGQQSDAANIGRVAALMAGLPVNVPGWTCQRNCVSGMMAISSAYQAIQAGDGDVFLCGGAESMSTAPYVVRGARWGLKLRHTTFIDTLWEGLTDPVCDMIMGYTAENLAMLYGLTREQLDKFAEQSHKKAFMATRMNKFRDEIVPVPVIKRVAGQEVAREEITQDECINPTLNVQKAALYPTVFKKGGVVTPANACPISDGAAAVVVMTADKAQELGIEPLAYIRAYDYAAIPPEIMGLGPAYAIPRALDKAGLKLTDIDLIELNEAFAAQVIAVGMELEKDGWDWNKVNVNGGAIALGHPVGCTGTRIAVTLVYEMIKRDAKFGLTTACVGGGMGGAMIIERK